MKTIFSLLFVFVTFISFAQESLIIKEEKLPMSKGVQDALVVNIPQMKAGDIAKDWDRYIKNNSKAKTGTEKNEFYVLEVIISRISSSSLNLYSLFTETTTGTKLSVFIMQNDIFISEEINPAIHQAAKSFIHDFAKQSYIKGVEAELKIENDQLKKLEKELESLYKEKDNEQKNISKNKSDIDVAENEIVSKKNAQNLKEKEIMAQREKMIGVNLNPEEKKLQDKIISNMEKEKQSLIKDQQNLRKDIQKYETSIKNSEREITSIDSKISLKVNEVQKQKELVQKVEMKLNQIKKL